MIIEYDQLKQQFGGVHPAEVAARLERAGVRFILGRSGRPFTTVDALNHAMGIQAALPASFDAPNQKSVIKVL